MKRAIGIHLRYKYSPKEMFANIQKWKINALQCFVSNLLTGRTVNIDTLTAQAFRRLVKTQLSHFYAHGSYRINLASPTQGFHPALEYELKAAERLGCTHYILHPGACKNKTEGIDAIARMINYITKKKSPLKLILENTAYESPTIGSNIEDFVCILKKINHPDQLNFCIDTAHAHAAGYQFEANYLEPFIKELESTIGIHRIAVIHLNNTDSECKSFLDIHCQLENGQINLQSLKDFALHPKLAHIPLILELPQSSEIQEQAALNLIKSWHTP